MKKYSLLKSDNNIIRVLEIQGNKILIIDCIKQTMPVWVDSSVENNYSPCSDSDLMELTGYHLPCADTLTYHQRKTMHERYRLIAPILPYIADSKLRSDIISSISTERGISKQSIRNYLCLYLVYLNTSILTPKARSVEHSLTTDQKNMRWALNKFFYSKNKNSLNTVYTLMLKEKYCDSLGRLLEKYPSFYQFRYFYRKTRKMQNYYISRNGLSNYQRNYRPLTGNGIQEFAPTVGTGMLDATLCDIYLVNESGNLVGRPILTACIDAYSGLCCGLLPFMGRRLIQPQRANAEYHYR